MEFPSLRLSGVFLLFLSRVPVSRVFGSSFMDSRIGAPSRRRCGANLEEGRRPWPVSDPVSREGRALPFPGRWRWELGYFLMRFWAGLSFPRVSVRIDSWSPAWRQSPNPGGSVSNVGHIGKRSVRGFSWEVSSRNKTKNWGKTNVTKKSTE